MSYPTLLDHVLALSVIIIYPAYAALTVKKFIEQLRAGGETARVKAYRNIVATWLFFGLCVAGLWYWQGRDWASLGFKSATFSTTMIALAIAAIFIALFVIPLRSNATSTTAKDMTEQLGDISLFMPTTRKEERWFKVVSLNAGITEEIVFRGYFLWYLQAFVPLYWAAAIAAIAFAVAHAYQGIKQIPGILLVSSVAVGLFVYTESLFVPILFHILLDALQGHYIARIRRRVDNSESRIVDRFEEAATNDR